MRHPAFLCATRVLASAVAWRTLAAQMFLGFGGLEARGGIADAKTGGSSATFEVDLGYAFLPELRTTLGIDSLARASIARSLASGWAAQRRARAVSRPCATTPSRSGGAQFGRPPHLIVEPRPGQPAQFGDLANSTIGAR